MDKFNIVTPEVTIVEKSEFVQSLSDEYSNKVMLIYNGYAYSFTSIDGGNTESGDTVITLESDNNRIPSSNTHEAGVYELHTDSHCYTLHVYRRDILQTSRDSSCDDYPTLVLYVRDHESYEYGFGSQMQASIDSRWTRHYE